MQSTEPSVSLGQAGLDGEGSGLSVLVVDDEELILAALGQTLGREGYRVKVASNAEEALQRLEGEEFAVILTDQRMPGLSGLQLLARAKEIRPDATRLLMTGVLDLGTVIESINKGEIYRFIVKPWLREELLVTMTNAGQRHELIRHNRELQEETQAMNARLGELNRSLAQQVEREAEQNHQLAELNLSLEQNLRRSVELCLNTLQTFYPVLGAQARRVFEICRAMADDLEMAADERQTLEISAWLHDIGLVGVPRRLIKLWQKSPRMLNEAEVRTIKQHPVLGQELAGFAHNLRAVGPVIRGHHERFDGSGYPDGLSGENIPWLARLLAVAVSFAEGDHGAWDPAGVEAIVRESGKAFDPEAVRLFCRCRPRAAVPMKEREILIAELEAGMILAQGIYSPNGLLLIPEGELLNQPSIDKLKNHNRVNPIRQSLVVYC